MTAKEQTPAEQFRGFVTETLKDKKIKQADKIKAIVADFEEWLQVHQTGTRTEAVGALIVVEHVEAYGLRIGLDATGRASTVEQQEAPGTQAGLFMA